MYTIKRPWWPRLNSEPFTWTFEDLEHILPRENFPDSFPDYLTKFHIGNDLMFNVNLAGTDPSTVSVKYNPEGNSIDVFVAGKLKQKFAVPALVASSYSPPKISASWNQGLLTIKIEGVKEQPRPALDIPITEGTSDTRKFLQE